PPPAPPHPHPPPPALAGFKANLAALPIEDRVAWQRHKIRNGESLGSIAKKYRTTIGAIRSANHISGDIIRAGDSLLIPSAAEHERYAMTAASRLAKRQASLAKVYGAEPITYTVKSGDSLWKIARDHGVGMRELARWNGMGTTGMLKVGTDLKIFKSSHEPVLSATKPRQQVRKLNYRVRRGESLALIASKFNVSVQNIRNWNQALAMKKYIHPGDRLTLYVDVTSLIN
ncbi:MAG: LysM peptidoglycan-binding domain-containing protein, partial [Gammaproteobacteria bacterium]